MIFITIDRSKSISLTQQIYDQVRNGILEKQLKEGEKLPSSRELAGSIGVSRNIVLEAYERLIAEGYLEVRPKSGTFVAQGTSLSFIERTKRKDTPKKMAENQAYIDFKAGNPAIDYFPRKKWAQLTKEICLHSTEAVFGYGDASGMKELKDALVVYLKRVRGVQCRAEQIFITSGATQGLKLITEMLGKENKAIAVEDPVTDEMRNIFTFANADIIPVPVDENGIDPNGLPKQAPSFVFVIPSHQFPLGGILSIQRRLQLIEYAQKMNCYIVEDDYDSEFTYEGAPVPSIQGIAPNHVIYVGTFSKILSPGLRIGYVILPEELVDSFEKIKWFSDRHTSSLEQLVLAHFIREGYLDRHVRKMKKIYKEKRERLVAAIQQNFHNATIIGKSAGMHLVVEIPDIDFHSALIHKMEQFGVKVYPIEQYSLEKGKHKERIVMGYGGLSLEEMEKGVHLLRRMLEENGKAFFNGKTI
ncbi:PLP-dependent aminotransferase family protein [Cytobacillus oceanisediminis]|uniref:MocR-like pyridoxine biosynthesis transcription factor PdxR n=1 Tax=Cytobacillus oceanisediminis TaxID=665099 RepID=UPI001CCB2786|nr:PLP-dependent aminotransferase family protein [Cytobacillus oceanisediminis]MBZ9536450.1 PLP-dependent aminotransferase family protein [Cytobacillus oceanisediminis]